MSYTRTSVGYEVWVLVDTGPSIGTIRQRAVGNVELLQQPALPDPSDEGALLGPVPWVPYSLAEGINMYAKSLDGISSVVEIMK